MNEKMNERKNIIISLKSNFGEPKNGIEKRLSFLKGMTILNLTLTLFSAGILVLSIISELFNYEIFEWKKTGLLAILSLSFILNLPNQYFELKLLNHLKKLGSKSEYNGIDKLNIELKIIIENLNNRLKNGWVEITLAIIILIMGIWQMGFSNNNNNHGNSNNGFYYNQSTKNNQSHNNKKNVNVNSSDAQHQSTTVPNF